MNWNDGDWNKKGIKYLEQIRIDVDTILIKSVRAFPLNDHMDVHDKDVTEYPWSDNPNHACWFPIRS
jgi:hypothetical protein